MKRLLKAHSSFIERASLVHSFLILFALYRCQHATMPLDIIGAGFGRIGTFSLKAALDQLGYPCYHMVDVIQHHEDQKWLQCDKAILNSEGFDFDTIFVPADRPAYRAACDHPAITYYKEILKQNPKAKVILTIRDSPEVWHKSAMDTIYTSNTQNKRGKPRVPACLRS